MCKDEGTEMNNPDLCVYGRGHNKHQEFCNRPRDQPCVCGLQKLSDGVKLSEIRNPSFFKPRYKLISFVRKDRFGDSCDVFRLVVLNGEALRSKAGVFLVEKK